MAKMSRRRSIFEEYVQEDSRSRGTPGRRSQKQWILAYQTRTGILPLCMGSFHVFYGVTPPNRHSICELGRWASRDRCALLCGLRNARFRSPLGGAERFQPSAVRATAGEESCQLLLLTGTCLVLAFPASAEDSKLRDAVEADVQKCLSGFDPLEVANHRRIAMRYCFGNNNYAERFHFDRMPAYEQCMRENDTLTAFCSRELRYRGELTRLRNLDDQKCPVPMPTSREAMVILNGGPADRGRPVVIPTTGPGLPAILLSPIEPGTLQRTPGMTANAQPVPAPSEPVAPTASRNVQPQSAPVSPAPAPVSPAPAPTSPQERQQQIAERQQQARERARKYAECRQQAVKDHPVAGTELMKAFAACVQIMQAK